jgi:hypothetical protein
LQLDCQEVKNKKAIRLLDGIDNWANRKDVLKNIQAPYESAISLFESRFQLPIETAALLSEKLGNPFITNGTINSFLKDLDTYAGRVANNKISPFKAFEGFMTGTMLGKSDPVLFETIKDVRRIVENDARRSLELEESFNNVLSQIKISGQLPNGKKITDKQIDKAFNNYRKLELEYVKALDSGDKSNIQKTKEDLTNFENSGITKTFVDFIKLVENATPLAIKEKYNDEVELAKTNKDAKKRVEEYDNGTRLVRLDKNEYYKYFQGVGVDERSIPALKEYNELMTQSYADLRNGITEVINSTILRIKGRPDFKGTEESLSNIKEKLLSELMPKYKEDGYFPHYVRDLNNTMMDGLMSHIEDLNKSSLDLVKEKKSIDDIIENMQFWITNHANSRSQSNDFEYSKNFIDVINSYIHNVNKFNTTSFLNSSFLKSVNLAKKTYDQESDYASKVVDIIDSIHGTFNGNTKQQGSAELIRRTLLSYQFTNKLGFSLRSAARNSTQYLMNYATFGRQAMKESRKYLDKANITLNVKNELQKANLLMDTSEAALESGVKTERPLTKIRTIDPETGKIIYIGDENYVYKGLKIFARGSSYLAKKSSWFHRTAENWNREKTFEIAYGQIHKLMNETPLFRKNIEERIQSGDLKRSEESEIKRIARAYAKNMVIVNHFDYNAYAKARNLREGIGQFAFQFQHYGMEFMERNYAIWKESMGDLQALGDDSFSNWLKDARGVHKAMNMATAYLLAPFVITSLTGVNQTLIEHVGVEIGEDIALLLTTDLDDEEQVEKLNRNFYGKGIIGSKLGPTFGTLMDIGIQTELINADNEYLDNLIINTGDFTNDDNTDKAVRDIKLLNQMGGRIYDRYIPMILRRGLISGVSTSISQELTFYPKPKNEPNVLQDALPPFIKDKMPNYYFDRIKKKPKRSKYQGLPFEIRKSFEELERRGK